MYYENRFGSVNILKDKKLNNKTVAISMSGGADSTLLCYMLANTIQEHKLNIQIQPYNGFDISVPGDSAGLPKIIKYIQNKFPNVKLNWPISCVYDTQEQDTKNTYIRFLIETLSIYNVVHEIIQAVCLGPPKEIQKSFLGDQYLRRPGYQLWEEVSQPKNYAPFVGIDKRFIIQCYVDLGIEDLLEITSSCTRAKGNCGECWWCQERKWAIDEVKKT